MLNQDQVTTAASPDNKPNKDVPERPLSFYFPELNESQITLLYRKIADVIGEDEPEVKNNYGKDLYAQVTNHTKKEIRERLDSLFGRGE
jgi:hypothetical protein